MWAVQLEVVIHQCIEVPELDPEMHRHGAFFVVHDEFCDLRIRHDVAVAFECVHHILEFEAYVGICVERRDDLFGTFFNVLHLFTPILEPYYHSGDPNAQKEELS